MSTRQAGAGRILRSLLSFLSFQCCAGLVGAAACVPAISQSTGAPSAQDAGTGDSLARIVITVADDVVAVLSTPDGRAARFGQNASPQQLAAWDARVDRWIAQLSPIDGAALMERPEWVIHGVLREGLEADRARRVCRDSTAANGLACYHARLRSYTTLPLTSDEVTRIAAGLRRSLDDELRPLVQKILGTSDVNVYVAFSIMLAAAVVMFAVAVFFMNRGTGMRE